MPTFLPRVATPQLLFRFGDHRGHKAVASQVQASDSVDRAVAGFPETSQPSLGTAGQQVLALLLDRLTQPFGADARAGGAIEMIGGAGEAGGIGIEQAAQLSRAQADGRFHFVQESIHGRVTPGKTMAAQAHPAVGGQGAARFNGLFDRCSSALWIDRGKKPTPPHRPASATPSHRRLA
jgi:hypothetical protein